MGRKGIFIKVLYSLCFEQNRGWNLLSVVSRQEKTGSSESRTRWVAPGVKLTVTTMKMTLRRRCQQSLRRGSKGLSRTGDCEQTAETLAPLGPKSHKSLNSWTQTRRRRVRKCHNHPTTTCCLIPELIMKTKSGLIRSEDLTGPRLEAWPKPQTVPLS